MERSALLSAMVVNRLSLTLTMLSAAEPKSEARKTTSPALLIAGARRAVKELPASAQWFKATVLIAPPFPVNTPRPENNSHP